MESLEDDNEDIFMKSIHDRYAARPDNLNDKCLAYFAVNYDTVNNNEESSMLDVENDPDNNSEEHGDEEGDGHTTNRQNEMITLKDGLGKMRKRKQESILRTKRYNISKECEKYFHGQLLLYYPWCSECELKNGFSTYEEHYESIKDVVDHNVRHFKQHSKYIENAFEELAENGPPESVWDAVAPTIEEDNVAARNEGFYAVQNLEEEDLAEHNHMMLESRDENSDTVLNKSVLSVLYPKEA